MIVNISYCYAKIRNTVIIEVLKQFGKKKGKQKYIICYFFLDKLT